MLRKSFSVRLLLWLAQHFLGLIVADDVAKVLPGSHKETQKQGEEWAAKAGVKLDSVVSH